LTYSSTAPNCFNCLDFSCFKNRGFSNAKYKRRYRKTTV